MDDFESIRNKVENELKDYEFKIGFNPESAIAASYTIWKEKGFFRDCTEESRAACLLDTLVYGLNPLKKQCYYVKFYDKSKKSYVLQFIMDYSGAVIVAKDINKEIKDIRSKIVKDGDIFDFEIENGLYKITKHKPTIDSLDGDFILAYAIAVDKNDKPLAVDIMTKKQYISHVKQTGKNINGEPIVKSDGSFHPFSNHAKYPEKMFLKTVIHRVCRSIIKTSPNEKIITASVRTVESDDVHDAEFTEENSIPLDFDKEELQPEQIEHHEISNKEQLKILYDLEVKAGRADRILQTLSSFANRQINRMSELTTDETSRYIEIVKKELESKGDEKQAGPSWG